MKQWLRIFLLGLMMFVLTGCPSTDDKTPPVITLNGKGVMIINKGDEFKDPGARANDNVDGDITTKIVVKGVVDTSKVGTYTLTYEVSDKAGNNASKERKVIVKIIDNEAPDITLLGDNPLYIKKNSNYIEPGATAEDNIDGIINVEINSSVNTNKAGEYIVTYTAKDKAGNKAQKNRIVKVQIIDNNQYYKYYEQITDRVLDINLTRITNKKIYYIRVSSTASSSPMYHYDGNYQMLYFLPPRGYLGKLNLTIYADVYDNLDEIKINIEIYYKKPPVTPENMDYTLSFYCDESALIGYPQYYSVRFVNNNLETEYILYNNSSNYSLANTQIIPTYSRIILDYFRGGYGEVWNTNRFIKYYTEDKKHHVSFQENIDKQMKLTCTYPNGYWDIIFPIDSEKWYATKPSPLPAPQMIYSRNNLFFYISILSDIYSKIYLENYKSGISRDNSYKKADEFMKKVFPGTHYKGELINNFNLVTKKFDYKIDYSEIFKKDNELSIQMLISLSKELTDGNLEKLVEKIVENYKTYYLSENRTCLDNALCGILFPEYTQIETINYDFSNGLDSWIINKHFVEPAIGYIEYIPNRNEVNMEYRSNRPSNTNDSWSSMELYKIKNIVNNSFSDYFINFDFNRVLGDSQGGHPTMACWESSGYTGGYVSFLDKNRISLGWFALSDHCNKADIGWGVKKIESSDKFYNLRIHDVVRRFKPKDKDNIFKFHLETLLKNHLPKIYKNKDKIQYIEYGIFATEFRNSYGGCYFCETKLNVNSIKLYKKK